MQNGFSLITTFACIAILSSAASAQSQYENFSLSSPKGKVIKNDTIISSNRLLASRMPAGPTLMQPAVNSIKAVPLAGHKAYYGKMTDFVNNYVRQYFGSHDRTLTTVKSRGHKQFPIIDNILRKNNVPKELKYLAVIESALNNNATSGVGAVGPWQFMDFTAREMGLTVTDKRDDRKDWYRSTNAACKYLNLLYSQLDDWLLVVAAYNCGPVPIKRAIQKTGSKSFWDIKKYLPRETQGHVLAFIATATIFENLNGFIGKGGMPADFQFENEKVPGAAKSVAPVKPLFTPEELAKMVIVRINEPIAIDILSEELGIEKKLLNNWNNDYNLFEYNSYSETFYGLRIPKEKLEAFIEAKSELTKNSRHYYSEME